MGDKHISFDEAIKQQREIWKRLQKEMDDALKADSEDSIVTQFMRLQDERDELKAKIKAFFEAFKVGPHPVNDGRICMVVHGEYGGNPCFWECDDESEDEVTRRKALWALWDAVQGKSE